MMTLSLFEEKGRFRVYDEETKLFSSASEKIEDLMKVLVRNRDIRLYISMDAFSVRKTVLPHFESDKIREILPYEMEGFFLTPSAALVMDFFPLGAAEKGTEGLVFALKKETAEEYIAPFLKAGLNLISLSPAWDNRLSEYGVDEGFFYKTELNLAPAGLTGEKKKRKARDVYRTTFLYVVALLLVCITGFSLRYFLLVKKESRIRKEVSAVYTGLFPDQKTPPDLYYGIQSKLAELKQNYRAFKGIEVLGILRSVSESSREGVRVKEINMDGNKVTLKGEGADHAAIEQFRNNLKRSFNEAQLLETKNMPDGKSGFAIEVTVNE
jgi:GspL periplasmic domain